MEVIFGGKKIFIIFQKSVLRPLCWPFRDEVTLYKQIQVAIKAFIDDNRCLLVRSVYLDMSKILTKFVKRD